MNLKNDRLRKRFDSLKVLYLPFQSLYFNVQYDVQKVENVIYDLQVRGVTAKRKKPEQEEMKE